MWKITLGIFIKSLRFKSPWVRKNGFYESVYLSVSTSVHLKEKLILLYFWTILLPLWFGPPTNNYEKAHTRDSRVEKFYGWL